MWFLIVAAALAADPLLAGDPAPPLEATWLKGAPVAPGTTGKPLFVDFTATWCGPCARFLPTFTAIGTSRAHEVDVVSVHVFERDPEAATSFVAAHAPEALPPRVAYSPPGLPHAEAAWMDAAGRDGLPSVFIVAADGRIAWIGYPEDGVVEVLDAVVAGTWDIEAERASALRSRRRSALVDQWSPALQDAQGRALKPAERLAVLEAAAAETPDVRQALASAWFEALRATDPAAAVAFAEAASQDTDAYASRSLKEMADALITDRRLAGHEALAVPLAEAANARFHGAHADLQLALAQVHWKTGDGAKALAAARRAVAIEADDATHDAAVKTLARYEAASARPGASRR